MVSRQTARTNTHKCSDLLEISLLPGPMIHHAVKLLLILLVKR